MWSINWRSWRLLGIGLAGVVLAAGSVALAIAPYLPRLLWEGYPSATWPAPGSYATVEGSEAVAFAGASPKVAPGAGLEALFEASEGRALLVVRHGRLTLEHYAPGIGRETRLNSYSMVKSLVAALLLKAVAEGRIASLDDPLGRYLDEVGPSLALLPIRDLADMRSGIAFEATGELGSLSPGDKDIEATRLNPFGAMGRLHMQGPSSLIGGLVVDPARRGQFSYQNVNTALIGALLEKVYGRGLEDLLSEKIWRPAGARTAAWRRYHGSSGVTAYCCLFARPVDWAMVGHFLMHNGAADAPFLPEALWRELLGAGLTDGERHAGAYRLHVRHDILDREGAGLAGPFSFFFGSRGQITYLMPQQDLVVVRFGARIQKLHSTLYEIGGDGLR
ncbi:MAG: serine hydrolase [Hyphomicrobiaceae bacterium]